MAIKAESSDAWQGRSYLEAGIGVFYGNAGDNRLHKHWAHQIVLGVPHDVHLVASSNTTFNGKAIWIEAGTAHCLEQSRLLSVYLDPMHALVKPLRSAKKDPGLPISLMNAETSTAWLTQLDKDRDLNAFVDFLKKTHWSAWQAKDNRLDRILQQIRRQIESGLDANRSELARMASLSPSRFSHWFKEQTGVPLRSYKKWIRMLRAMELTEHLSLTEAAIQTGFSDQAHFCRSVLDAFGVNPLTLKNILQSK